MQQSVWATAERLVARISFVLSVIGISERVYHYTVVYYKFVEKKRKADQFGFRVTENRSKHHDHR